MIYLLCSIIASTLIFIIFKLFDHYRVNTLQAIIVNYLVATACGLLAYGRPLHMLQVVQYRWFTGSLFLGVLFILIFNLMALTTQRSGLSVVSVATKMSVVLPISFGILYFKENLGIFKLAGIALALVAVYLASVKQKSVLEVKRENILLPILVFLGSGVIDTSIKYLESTYVDETAIPLFSAMIFASAFVVGLFIVLVQFVRGTFNFALKNVVGGLALGIPNYFSIYFLVRALRGGLESSTIFTLNNVSIVLLSTLLGIVFFREKLLIKNWLGIGLAVISIILVSISL